MNLFWGVCLSSAPPYRQLGTQGWGSREEEQLDIGI